MLFHHVPRKLPALERREDGSLILNHSNLKILCYMQGLYEYPQMNNKLYLMYKTITKIENLEEYKNLKALYLQNNLIKKIENLEVLQQLQSLFLHNNMLTKIENLSLPKLKILNLSGNQLTKIEELQNLLQLESLCLSHNFMKNYEALEHLKDCSPTLTNVDLSKNQIDGDEKLCQLFLNIKCLNLSENPLVRQMKFYRRNMVGRLPQLLYLDSRTIDTQERMTAAAWIEYGDEGLKKVREDILQHRKEEKSRRSQQIMKDMDKHRNGKIILFKSAIQDCKREIQKFEQSMKDPKCQHVDYFERRIHEQRVKINDYYDMIIGIEKRLGKVVTEKEKQYELAANRLQIQQPNEIRAEDLANVILPADSDNSSTQAKNTSESDLSKEVSQSSQNRQPVGFYDQLD